MRKLGRPQERRTGSLRSEIGSSSWRLIPRYYVILPSQFYDSHVIPCEMVNSHYTILPTSENNTYHSRQRFTQLVWRTFKQRQTVIRRAGVSIIVVLLLCAGSLRLFRAQAWSSVPTTPSTPFVLKGLPSPHSSRLTDALDLATPYPAPYYRPECAPMSSINPRYASLSASRSNSTIYLALNLIDAQSVLPTFIHELPVLLSYMGSHRFHVSILENGSTDLTAGLLVVLARALAAIGTSYEVCKFSILFL